jgi:hypothetical protein
MDIFFKFRIILNSHSNIQEKIAWGNGEYFH